MVIFYGFLIICAKFFIYSFFGWIIEVIAAYKKDGKFINRGFCVGPYVPIYGFCAILFLIVLKNETSPVHIFFYSALIATTIEYITSYIMEKIFKARWWDYSSRPFNINGRVYLVNSIIFGALGYILICLIDPKVSFILSNADPFWFSVIIIFIIFFFTFDVIFSFNVMQKIKTTADCIKKDYTEEITKKVRKILIDRSKAFERLFTAFPNVLVFNKRSKKKKRK